MQSGFLLNYYNNKNDKILKKMIVKIPKDLKNIIIDYKSSIDHNIKLEKVLKEMKRNRYDCACCNAEKSINICKIAFKCEACKMPTCSDCEDCDHFDESNALCDHCLLFFDIISQTEDIIGRNLTEQEMNDIGELVSVDNGTMEEINFILETIGEYVENGYTELGIARPTFEIIYQRLNSIINSIFEEDNETEDEENEIWRDMVNVIDFLDTDSDVEMVD